MWIDLIAKIGDMTEHQIVALLALLMCVLLVGYFIMHYLEGRDKHVD